MPSRELLGEMLLELGKPVEAQEEFAKSLQRDPNRLRGLQGAARAAGAAGHHDATRKFNAQLKALIAGRDSVRPELVPVLTATASGAER